ncbi:MAG: 3-dehydroquinate synthase [Thaumarchaeota archaeon]|nr:3-dehydroquinate synthase [Nitrososphaerota archaeon]
MLPPDKEIVLQVEPVDLTEKTLKLAKQAGIRRVIAKGALSTSVYFEGLSQLKISDEPGPDRVSWVKVGGAKDLKRAVAASMKDQPFVVVECSDWTIIPLENLVAEFRRNGRKLYAYAATKQEIETAFAILEKGVDGVVILPSSLAAAGGLNLPEARSFALLPAKLTRVMDAGVGDRACVDTTSQLEEGEGMLVGSRASFFFLVHGETLSSEYVPARPFRVNAGALHSYVLSQGGKTRYLSELESPDPVTIVDSKGNSRAANVGRVKIERRPLLLLEAAVGGKTGSVILQKAETIRLVRDDGSPVSVTELKAGDAVLVHTEQAMGRHFGGEVDEHVLEK